MNLDKPGGGIAQEWLPVMNVADGLGNEEIIKPVSNGEIAIKMIRLTRVIHQENGIACSHRSH